MGMKTLGSLAIAALILAGCSGEVGDEPVTEDEMAMEEETLPTPERAPLIVSPDAALEALAAQAADAWSAAGVPVVVGEGGTPVLVTPSAEMWTPCVVDGEPKSCLPSGKFEDGVIRIRDTANCPLRTLAHEIGHALGAEHVPAPSLMQQNPGRGCDWDGAVDAAAAGALKRPF